jgi:hypothetical protein
MILNKAHKTDLKSKDYIIYLLSIYHYHLSNLSSKINNMIKISQVTNLDILIENIFAKTLYSSKHMDISYFQRETSQ